MARRVTAWPVLVMGAAAAVAGLWCLLRLVLPAYCTTALTISLPLCLVVCCQEDQVTRVGLSRYSRVSRSAFALNGKKRIAVLRTSGAIIGACCMRVLSIASQASPAA